MSPINSRLGAVISRLAAHTGYMKLFLCILALAAGALVTSEVFSQNPRFDFKFEKDRRAPVDRGYGPNAPIGPPRPNLRQGQTPKIPKSLLPATPALGAAPKSGETPRSPKSRLAAPSAESVPIGGGGGGFFGPPFPWPIIPLHVALMPNGRVLNYGTDQQGTQTGQIVYDVWDPTLGIDTNSHTVLPNTTTTDIFCSAASIFDGSGKVLITGGDLTVGGVKNYSNNKVEVFNPMNNTLTASGQMNYARWYPSIITLCNGDKLLLGGTVSPDVPALTPEVFSATTGWRTLPGISEGAGTEWFYPRGFFGSDGKVILLRYNGTIARLNTAGNGTIQDTGSQMAAGEYYFPSVMFAPFKVLTVRAQQKAHVVDFSASPPAVTNVANLSYSRLWGNATLLADGKVLVSGGSGVSNELTNVAYQVEIYNPDPPPGTWTLGASAAKARLYHSAALLLPDGSVLTGGGGAPGPVNQLNAEIYYPAYLYLNDGSGNPAPRPTIVSAPSTALTLNQNFLVTVGANDTISKINLISLGSNTHSLDSEQRLVPVPFTRSGTQLTATLNAPGELARPGYYMLFVLNTAGVPSVAKIVSIANTSTPDVIVTSLSYSSATGLFTSVVKNQGTAPTPSGVAIGVSYWVDGVYRTWGGASAPLAAGASATVGTGGGAYFIPNGTHTIMAWVDDVNRFAEFCEANNQLSQNITVGGGGADTSAPSIPTGLAGTAVSSSQINLTWTASTDNVGVTGYKIFRNGTQVGTSATTSYSDTGLTASTAYSYAVSAYDAAGNNSARSSSVSVTTQGGASLPDVIVTSLSYSSATGLFTSVVKNQGTAPTPSGVAIGVSYWVDGVYRTWGGASAPLAAGASATVGTGGGAYFIPNGTHTIMAWVDDVNRFAESNETNNQLSQTITVGGADTSAPSIPTGLAGTAVSSSQINLTWTASTDNVGVTGYKIFRNGTQVGTSATTSYSDTGLTASTAYSYAVSAYDAAGNNSARSSSVSVTTQGGASLPDVIVTSLSYSSATGLFTSVVKNQGTAPTPSGVAIGVSYWVDGVYRTWGGASAPLAAGASATVGTGGGAYFIPNGTHTIMAWVDDVNRFAESNETNNTRSQTITIP